MTFRLKSYSARSMRQIASPTREVLEILRLEERESLFELLRVEIPQPEADARVGIRDHRARDVAVPVRELVQFLVREDKPRLYFRAPARIAAIDGVTKLWNSSI